MSLEAYLIEQVHGAVGKRELVWRKHASGRAIDPHGWESEDGMKIKQSLLKTVP